jgi:hypothetical protein
LSACQSVVAVAAELGAHTFGAVGFGAVGGLDFPFD